MISGDYSIFQFGNGVVVRRWVDRTCNWEFKWRTELREREECLLLEGSLVLSHPWKAGKIDGYGCQNKMEAS